MTHPLVAAAALAALAVGVAASPPSQPGGDDDAAATSASASPPPPAGESSSSPSEPVTVGGSAGSGPGSPADVTIKTIPGAPVTVPGEAPPHASIDQLVAASQRFLGPSTDMTAAFAGLVDVPPGIPTPAGSTVLEMMLSLEPSDEADDSYYYGTVTFESTATASDIAEFYETLLPAAGYPQSGDSTSSDEGGRRRTLEFDIPTAEYWLADITVTLTESVTDDEVTPTHELRWYADADESKLEPFLGWAPGLPLPADATPASVLFSTSAFLDVDSVSVEVAYDIPGVDPVTMHSTFEGQLPRGGYAIDADEDIDGSTTMTGPGIPQISIYWNEGYPTGTRATVRGRVVL